MKKIIKYILLATSSILVIFAIVIFSQTQVRYHIIAMWSSIFEADFDYWELKGNQIVKEIEIYKQKNGKYPEKLKQLSNIKIHTIYGDWKYHNYGETCILSLGEYGDHGWELEYYSNSHRWSVDK